mgnify:CR=1 FL=1
MNILYAQQNIQNGSGIAAFLPMLLIGIIFYFLILRPQTKSKKDHEKMLSDLKKGDRIITRGGIYGKIVNFQGKNNSIIIIDTGGDYKLSIARSYISGLSNNQ